MADITESVRFLISPSPDGGDPQFVIKLEGGFRLTLTASFDPMTDSLDEIFDTVPLGDEDGPDQLPAFGRKDRPAG
jgi:hypothetical protein